MPVNALQEEFLIRLVFCFTGTLCLRCLVIFLLVLVLFGFAVFLFENLLSQHHIRVNSHQLCKVLPNLPFQKRLILFFLPLPLILRLLPRNEETIILVILLYSMAESRYCLVTESTLFFDVWYGLG
jgi:hypothetical protein